MKLRRLGNTQMYASEIALGTVELGLDYGIPGDGGHLRPSETEAIRVLNHALDCGISFIDTARAYGNSEELIGKALGRRRNEYVLATKLCPLQASDLDALDLNNRIRESVETSLRMLQTDCIDLLMLHSAPTEVIQRADTIFEPLRKWQQAGHIRHLGATVYGETGAVALERGGFDCLQIAYNVLDRTPEANLLSTATKNGVGIVVRSVLLKGALTSRYRDLPESLHVLKDAVCALETLAQSAGITLPELAFRYVLLNPHLITLCGTARSEELVSAVEYADHGPLDEDLINEIRKIEIDEPKWLNPGNWNMP